MLFDELELGLLADLLGVDLELRLINLSLSLDQVSLGLSLGIGDGETSGADSLVFGLKLPEVLIHLFILNLGVDLQALQHSIRLLLESHGLMLGGRLLRSSLNLEGHVDRLLKRGASLLFNRVNGLNIHLSDLQVVCSYMEGQEVTCLIFLVHCILDDLSRIFMEILKCNS